MTTLKPSQLREIAEIVDSKGSISIGLDNYKNKQYFYEQYRLSGKPEVLDPLKEIFGGTISRNGSHCKIIWRVTADKAFALFNQVYPFVEKRKSLVDKMLEFGKFRSQVASMDLFTEERRIRREEFIDYAQEVRRLVTEEKSVNQDVEIRETA